MIFRKASGWWTYKPYARSMTNVTTGQRVTLDAVNSRLGPRKRRKPGDPWWKIKPLPDQSRIGAHEIRLLLLRYEDSDVRLPLVVSCVLSLAWERATWTLHYDASAKLWDDAFKTSDGAPLFGLWRRLEECVVDAFVNWPESADLGASPDACRSVGAWVNGSWIEDAAHEASAPFAWDRKTFSQVEAAFVPPLDDKPKYEWRFVKRDAVSEGACLDGVVERPGERAFLPQDVPLGGFQDRVPHVVSTDGQAAFFPMKIESYTSVSRDEHRYTPRVVFLYADEDVFVEAMIEISSGGTWRINPSLRRAAGVRSHPVRDDIARLADSLESRQSAPAMQHTHAAWNRIHKRIADCCLAWDGCDCRLLDNVDSLARHARDDLYIPPHELSGVVLGRCASVEVSGADAAGVPQRPVRHVFHTTDAGLWEAHQKTSVAQLIQELHANPPASLRGSGSTETGFLAGLSRALGLGGRPAR